MRPSSEECGEHLRARTPLADGVRSSAVPLAPFSFAVAYDCRRISVYLVLWSEPLVLANADWYWGCELGVFPFSGLAVAPRRLHPLSESKTK